MTTFTEGRHAAEFVLSEAQGQRSRENVTQDESTVLAAGQVVGKVTASGEYAQHDQDASDGTEAAAGIALYAKTTGAGAPVAISIIARDAEVNGELLVWQDDITGGEITTHSAELAALGIIVR